MNNEGSTDSFLGSDSGWGRRRKRSTDAGATESGHGLQDFA